MKKHITNMETFRTLCGGNVTDIDSIPIDFPIDFLITKKMEKYICKSCLRIQKKMAISRAELKKLRGKPIMLTPTNLINKKQED